MLLMTAIAINWPMPQHEFPHVVRYPRRATGQISLAYEIATDAQVSFEEELETQSLSALCVPDMKTPKAMPAKHEPTSKTSMLGATKKIVVIADW